MSYPGQYVGAYFPGTDVASTPQPPKPATGGSSLLQQVVKICDDVTNSLKFQTLVQVMRYIGPSDDGLGTKQYATSSTIRAVLEKRQRHVKTPNGGLAYSTATLIFLDATGLLSATPEVTLPNGNVHQAGLVDVDDYIILPDGTQQTIVSVGGYVIPQTGHPVATEVALG